MSERPSAKPPAFQFYPKDWLSSERVRLLRAFGRGVFIDLLAIEWDRGGWEGGTVPSDPASVAVLVGESAEDVEAIWPRLRECFETSAGDPFRMFNRKLEEVRTEYRAYHEKKVLGGIESGKARARKRKAHKRSREMNTVRTQGGTNEEQTGNPSLAPSPTSLELKDLELNTLVRENADDALGEAETIRALHEHFNRARGGRTLKLTADRRAKYRARLRSGFKPAEIVLAIDAALADPFYRGDNDQATRYDFPETVLKNDAALDRHLTRAEEPRVRPIGKHARQQYGNVKAADDWLARKENGDG